MGALISNEHGYSGMQGRGFFAGVSGYGFHAEYSQNGGFDWGGSTTAYLSAGNQSNIAALDGTTTSMVTTDISIPTLGFNYNLGAYDVSKVGMANAQRKVLYEIFDQFKNDPEAIRLKELYEDSERGASTIKYADDLDAWLLSVGMEHVKHPDHGDGSKKRTYRWATPGKRNINYGNIEFCVGPNWDKNAAYQSYNYGNNTFSHVLIDLFGYWGRGY